MYDIKKSKNLAFAALLSLVAVSATAETSCIVDGFDNTNSIPVSAAQSSPAAIVAAVPVVSDASSLEARRFSWAFSSGVTVSTPGVVVIVF